MGNVLIIFSMECYILEDMRFLIKAYQVFGLESFMIKIADLMIFIGYLFWLVLLAHLVKLVVLMKKKIITKL